MSYILYLSPTDASVFQHKNNNANQVLSLHDRHTIPEQLQQIHSLVKKNSLQILLDSDAIERLEPGKTYQTNENLVYSKAAQKIYTAAIPLKWRPLWQLLQTNLKIGAITVVPFVFPYLKTAKQPEKTLQLGNLLFAADYLNVKSFAYFQQQTLTFARYLPTKQDKEQALEETRYYCRHHFENSKNITPIIFSTALPDIIQAAIKYKRKLPTFTISQRPQYTKLRPYILLAFPVLWAFLLWNGYDTWQKKQQYGKQFERLNRSHNRFLAEKFPDVADREAAFNKQVLIDSLHQRQLDWLVLYKTLQLLPNNNYLLNSLSIERSDEDNTSEFNSAGSNLKFGNITINTAKTFYGRLQLDTPLKNTDIFSSTENIVLENIGSSQDVWGKLDNNQQPQEAVVQFKGSQP